MSGIYIPGMKLPESCGSCDTQGLKNAIWHFGFGCDGDIDDFANCPPARCPLFPVPEHGRLIDADELDIYRREEQAWHDYEVFPEEYLEGVKDGLHEAAKCVSTAPTVIPANKEGRI